MNKQYTRDRKHHEVKIGKQEFRLVLFHSIGRIRLRFLFSLMFPIFPISDYLAYFSEASRFASIEAFADYPRGSHHSLFPKFFMLSHT